MDTPPTQFVPRRGRPTAEQVKAIEAALITVARRHFLENGFDGVAMEAVAAELGVSKGTLYGRYPTKDALFHAVVQDAVTRWSTPTVKLDEALSLDIEQRLRHHARSISESQANPEVQAFRRIIVSTADRFPASARSMHEVGFLYIVRLIAEDIRDAALRDGIPSRDPQDVATRMVATISGWHMQESIVREVPTQEIFDFGDRTVTLMMAARMLW